MSGWNRFCPSKCHLLSDLLVRNQVCEKSTVPRHISNNSVYFFQVSVFSFPIRPSANVSNDFVLIRTVKEKDKGQVKKPKIRIVFSKLFRLSWLYSVINSREIPQAISRYKNFPASWRRLRPENKIQEIENFHQLVKEYQPQGPERLSSVEHINFCSSDYNSYKRKCSGNLLTWNNKNCNNQAWNHHQQRIQLLKLTKAQI